MDTESRRSRHPVPPPSTLCVTGLAAFVLAACGGPGEPVEVQPFQRDVSVEVVSGSLSGSVSFTVPEDRRLVIEYVSGSVRVSDEELVRVNVRTTVGGEDVTHTIPNHVYRRDFDPPTTDDFIVTYGQVVRIHADPGTQVRVTATRSENAEVTPTFFALAMSGRWIGCGTSPGCPLP